MNRLIKLFVGCGFATLVGLMAGCDKPTPNASQDVPVATTETTPPVDEPAPIVRRPNVSQQFVGLDLVNVRLAKALQELPYEVQTLNDYAKSVNQAVWTPPQAPSTQSTLDEPTVLRIQALLNWHHHGVGAVDGKMNKNTIKAMRVFQEKNGLPLTQTMDLATWQALSANQHLNEQPVLVRYELTADDVKIYGGRSQYVSVAEKVAEKFHMSRELLKSLNPNTPLKAGNVITVYNPYQPNEVAVSRVQVKRKENILYAYDKDNNLVASYPTTVNLARTPKGSYKVTSRIMEPSYNKDFRNKKGAIPPGPNNPVGLVWIGISKPSFGIHGSPQPEQISQQTSAGCVRLTNWDALGLFGAIEEGAQVEFI